MGFDLRSSDAGRPHRVLGVRCASDPVLHALAPLGLAAARGTALVVDLDRDAPPYPGTSSLAALAVAQPRLDDLRPRRGGVAVLPNGLASPEESADVLEALGAGPATFTGRSPRAVAQRLAEANGAVVLWCRCRIDRRPVGRVVSVKTQRVARLWLWGDIRVSAVAAAEYFPYSEQE